MPLYCEFCHLTKVSACGHGPHPTPDPGSILGAPTCLICGGRATVECSCDPDPKMPEAEDPKVEVPGLLDLLLRIVGDGIGGTQAAATGAGVGKAVVERIDAIAEAYCESKRTQSIADLASALSALLDAEEATIAEEVREELASYFVKDPEAQA